MAELLQVIFSVIAPIFMVLGVAFFIGRWRNPNPESFALFIVYVFIPMLVFREFATTEMSMGDMGSLAGVVLGVMVSMAAIGYVMVRSGIVGGKRNDKKFTGAFVLSVVLMNAANYGIPLNAFAYGEAGEEIAILYYSMSVIIGNVIGVYFASFGSGSVTQAIINVFKVPILYAAALGMFMNLNSMELPIAIGRAVDIMADATIPAMLALLGLLLSQVEIRGNIRPIVFATLAKLAIAPFVAVPFVLLFGLSGVAMNVAIVQSATPTAVFASALAREFGSDAKFVSATTLVSTVASILTISIILTLLGGMV